MKKLLFHLSLLLLIFSCSKNDHDQNQIPDSQNSAADTLAVEDRVCNLFLLPSGWSIQNSGNDVRCFKRSTTRNNTSVTVYVLAVNLKNGAKCSPVYNVPTPANASSSNISPTFYKGDILYWWGNNSGYFGMANTLFFDFSSTGNAWCSQAQLAYGLKQSTNLRSCDYGNKDAFPKRKLNLFSTYATIEELANPPSNYTDAQVYNYIVQQFTGTTVVAGLHPINASKSPNDYVGRTMVGIKDCDGDGFKEGLYILTTRYAKQQEAYNILSTEFSCDQVIMLDGSGSTQMVCQGTEYVKSTDYDYWPAYPRRRFPVALAIKAKP